MRLLPRESNFRREQKMTDEKGAGEGFAKAISKGVLNAQDLEPGMSIMVGGYVFTGKYTTWADQINREFDARIRAERERCAKIAESHVTKFNGFQIADAIRGGQDGK